MSRTEVIAHRGTPREHRENTLAGFARAMALGADAIELDVHRTADDQVLVHHDPVVLRPEGGPPLLIGETSLGRIRSPQEGDPGIPTLPEVLELVSGRARVYVEVKAAGLEELLVPTLQGRAEWTAVHSFDHRIAARFRRLAPTIRTGVLLVSRLLDPAQPLRETGARDLWQQWEMIDADLVERAHAAGGRVIAWTVNDPSIARRLEEIDVDGVCTDICGGIR